MLNIGPLELLMLAVIVLLVVRPQDLPQTARSVARTLNELKRLVGQIKK